MEPSAMLITEADLEAFHQTTMKISKKIMNGESSLQAELGLTDTQLEAVYAIGFNYYRNRKNEEARRIFSFLTMINPLEYKFHFGLAAACQVQKFFDMAALHYLHSSIIDPSRPEPCYHLAECLVSLDDSEGAIENLQKAIERCGSDEAGQRIRNRSLVFLESLGKPSAQ
jgi:type III secretion system low calcium response chaperone LcrH/SycD